jgi:hypothetical protein
MRTNLIQELKTAILSKIDISFNQEYHDTFYTTYEPDEDEDPEEVFNNDGVIAIIEREYGDVFIDGLTPEEQTYLETA